MSTAEPTPESTEDEFAFRLTYAENGPREVRMVQLNVSNFTVLYQLDKDGSEQLTVAGFSELGTHADLVQVFEYLLDVVKMSEIRATVEAGLRANAEERS